MKKLYRLFEKSEKIDVVAEEIRKIVKGKKIAKFSTIHELLKFFIRKVGILQSQEICSDISNILSHPIEHIATPIEITEKEREKISTYIKKYVLTKLYCQ